MSGESDVFDDALVALFGNGQRLAILLSFAGQERTISDLAAEHGQTRQSMNYHLRTLEAAGWLAIVGEEKRHTAREPVWAETTQVDWPAIIAGLNALAEHLPEHRAD